MRNLTIIFIFLSASCFSQIEGLYEYKGVMTAMSYEAFCFNAGRFEHLWKSDLAESKSFGYYTIIGDTLTINSDIQIEDLIQVKTHKLDKLDSLYISVSTVSKEIPWFAAIKINNKSREYPIDMNQPKNIVFPRDSVNLLSLKCDDVDWRIQRLKFNIPIGTTFIEVIIDDTRGAYLPQFYNVKFLIKKFKIISITRNNEVYVKLENTKCK
jgi:hypothetical protein